MIASIVCRADSAYMHRDVLCPQNWLAHVSSVSRQLVNV